MKKNLTEIQIARAIAITGVLCVHGFSTAATQLPANSVLFPLYNFLNIAGKLGTPTFIMLSSFILFYTYFNRNVDKALIKNFYWKRIQYIVIPYLVFSLFYFLFKWQHYDIVYQDVGEAIEKLGAYVLFGKAHAHLYFVFVSVQFYVLFPLMLIWMKKSAWIRKYSILIGILIQWIWIYTNRYGFEFQYKGSIILSYASFYFLGAYLGIHYDSIKEKMKSINVRGHLLTGLGFGLGVMITLFTGYHYLVRTNAWYTIKQNLPSFIVDNAAEFTWGFYAIFASIFVLYISNIIVKKGSQRMNKWLIEIGTCSFGIYLIHPFLLIYFREWLPTTNAVGFHLWQLFTFIAVYVISWVIVRVTYNYVPYNWIIFGKGSKKNKKNTQK